MQILGNTVEQPINFATIATGSSGVLGGIAVVSASSSGRLVTTRANRDVTITGNRISNSGRAGIWVSNVAGGSIRDNVIVEHYRRPNLPLVGVAVADRADMECDFAKAIVVRTSDAVSEAGNTP